MNTVEIKKEYIKNEGIELTIRFDYVAEILFITIECNSGNYFCLLTTNSESLEDSAELFITEKSYINDEKITNIQEKFYKAINLTEKYNDIYEKEIEVMRKRMNSLIDEYFEKE